MSEDEREPVPNEVQASGQLVCPVCGYSSIATQAVREGSQPRLEDRTICWSCGGLGVYARTSLGSWHLRALTQEEAIEAASNPSVLDARRQREQARRAGRGPSAVGVFVGGAPRPPEPLIVLPAEPVSWDVLAEEYGLDAAAVHRLQDWTAANVPDRRFGPGSVVLACGACEVRVRVGPTAQQTLFAGAKVLCPVCTRALQRRFAEGGGS